MAKKSKLRRSLDLLYYELKKEISESESELNCLKHEYDEVWKARNKSTTQIMGLAKRIKEYENMNFLDRLFFLVCPKGFKK